MQKIHNISAFTIIELIIVIGLITIFVSLSYAGYATFTQRQKLLTAGQTMKNILRDVQSRSFNNESDCSVCNCDDPSATTQVNWIVDMVEREFYGQCGANNFSVTSFKLADEIQLTADNNTIQFFDNPPRVNMSTTICLSLSGLPSRFYEISLSNSGDISDSEGLISTCSL